jgi:hypothetical protein
LSLYGSPPQPQCGLISRSARIFHPKIIYSAPRTFQAQGT